MLLLRYMSYSELYKYLTGYKLVNNTDWSTTRKTKSNGFCFFKYNNSDDIIGNLSYMSGIVDDKCCCVFSIDQNLLTRSYGIYADDDDDDFGFGSISTKRIK